MARKIFSTYSATSSSLSVSFALVEGCDASFIVALVSIVVPAVITVIRQLVVLVDDNAGNRK